MRGAKLLLVSPAVRITSCLSATRSLASVGVFFLSLFAFCVRLSLSISDGCSIISTSWLPLFFVRPSLSLSLFLYSLWRWEQREVTSTSTKRLSVGFARFGGQVRTLLQYGGEGLRGVNDREKRGNYIVGGGWPKETTTATSGLRSVGFARLGGQARLLLQYGGEGFRTKSTKD